MANRYLCIWFRFLATDYAIRKQPALKGIPFVLATKVHERMVITAASPLAAVQGITENMVVADARALMPGLEVLDEQPGIHEKLLHNLGEWLIRFSPIVAIDLPNGLILDITGCAHLWKDERGYLKNILSKLKEKGYSVRAAIADTVGCAWAIARFGKTKAIIEEHGQLGALLSLPPEALRFEPLIVEKLKKLGLYTIKSFISMPRPALRKRFGQQTLLRIDQALGTQQELLTSIHTIEPYSERLPCLEPIATAKGIEIALQRLIGIYDAVLSLYISRLIKLVNKKDKQKCSLVFDEFPTIFFNHIDSLIATARSNKVATTLAMQDISQLKKDYGREQADVIVNITGNIISGQVMGETSKLLSDRFGKIMQERESLSINRTDTSISRSLQLDNAIPPSKIAALSSGQFVSMVADDPNEKIKLKMFHAEIINDTDRLNADVKTFNPIPIVSTVTQQQVMDNYFQVKLDIKQMIEEEVNILIEAKKLAQQ